MKKALLFLAATFVSLPAVQGFEVDHTDPVQIILLVCRRPDDPTPTDSLIHYAKVNGVSNEDMSAHLVELAKMGLGNETDYLQHQLATRALGMLSYFGGEKENAFVREVMLTTQDSTMRHVAVRAGIKMMPAKWEEWVREAATDNRFDFLTRFDAYEEAYQIGRDGDEETRRNVIKVLSEFAETDASTANQMDLRRWVEELKALGNAAGEEE